MRDYNFLIITGLSGSGKTVVSHFLEDLGYYCMDNLPAKLIPGFVDMWQRKEAEIEKVALVVDIRESEFATEFPRALKSIKKKASPWLIFLETSDEALIKRFSESRRPHPLSKDKSVSESITLERKRLAEIKRLADEVIDTSLTSVVDIKKHLSNRFAKRRKHRLHIVIISFGYKYGVPLDSDLVFDTRFLPNPFYIDALKNKTGRSKSVRDYVFQSDETRKFLEKLSQFIDYLIPKFVEEGKNYLNISLGCTGGKHRSVILAEELKKHLKDKEHHIRIHHRDIYK